MAAILSQKSRGVSVTLYPGGADQLQDTDEVERAGRSAAQQPAYRHLSSLKLNKLPLADFGNRIPNITAVLAFASEPATPAIVLTELPGMQFPGSLSGADISYMTIDPTRNRLISLKSESGGVWFANATALEMRSVVPIATETQPGYGLDGFIYTQASGGNRVPMNKIDLDTGEIVGSVGNTSTVGIVDDLIGFGNAGTWDTLTTLAVPGLGKKTLAVHLNKSFPAGGPPNGSIVDADAVTTIDSPNSNIVHTISIADGLQASNSAFVGYMVPDPDRGRFFLLQSDDVNGTYVLVKYSPTYVIGLSGAELQSIETELVHTFSRGTFGTDDFGGAGAPTGWALNRRTGDLILANGTSMLLYNPDTDQILATEDNPHLIGRNNYYNGGAFAFGDSLATAGTIYVIDTRTLKTLKTLDMQDMGFTGTEPGVFHEESMVWDDRTAAVIFSRIDTGSTAIAGEKIAKIFVNKVNGLGVGLDTVVSALCTEYNGITMAGMDAADFDVTTLTGDTVEGYTLNNKTTISGALTPLRNRFQFDAVQSDWKIKFPKRGTAPVLTIPEEFVGELKRGRTERDNPPVTEIRVQDTELPVKLNVRYRNKDADYDVDTEHDKRQRFPVPTMASKSERTLDIPIVDTPANMRPIAQNWLWTMWNERRNFKTIIPWTYIELDPTDVFNMGVFGETVRLRLTEQDIGLGYAMDISGTAEDTYTFASTIPAGLAKGRPLNVVPSNLPTIPIFLDTPLLHLADLNLTAVSNAYVTPNALESAWRGCTFLKSPDGTDFSVTGSASTEATLGKVKVAPPALVFQNGNPINRILEVADGGTMTITPLRGAGNWLSGTELNVLNGANNFAIIYPNGTVQIAQYIDATLNADGTITLDRLLLGRLGTEDIAAVAPPLSSQCVLLVDATGQKFTDSIVKQNLSFAGINIPYHFKAVTIGTLLEEASDEVFTYTGRDLRPYSVADLRAVPDGEGGLDVSWARRVRGPEQGEWLNLIPSPPLNETIEQYEVTLNTPSAGDFLTKVIDNLDTVNFTPGELALGGNTAIVPKQLWPNRVGSGDTIDGSMDAAGAEDPFADGGWVNIPAVNTWVYESGANGLIAGPVPGSETRVSPASTDYLSYSGSGATPVIRDVGNIIDLTAELGMTSDQIGKSAVRMNVWNAGGIDSGGGSPHGAIVELLLLDKDDNILDNITTGYFEADLNGSGIVEGDWISVGSIYDAANDPWPQRPLALALFDGVQKIQAILTEFKGGTTGTVGRVGFDHLELEVLSVPDDLTVKVVQVSETGLKSPVTQRNIS